jgi:hypothetical protein
MASSPSAVLPGEHGIDDLHDEALLSARQALDTLHLRLVNVSSAVATPDELPWT